MAVPEWIIALSIQFDVLFRGEVVCLEAMRRIKREAHPKEKSLLAPDLGKKILPLMQAHAMEWQDGLDALVDIRGQALRRHGPTFHGRQVVIQIAVIQFL